jgi:hypothetical protein
MINLTRAKDAALRLVDHALPTRLQCAVERQFRSSNHIDMINQPRPEERALARVCVTVAEEGRIAWAAERLGMQQPPLSQQNQRIVSANRVARTSLLLDDRGLRGGMSLWTIFERDPDLFRRRDQSDVSTRLLLVGSNHSRPTLVTPSDQNISASSNSTNINLHARPRLDLIDTLLKLAPAPQAHGGLSAGALRRVREYVQVHLSENIDLSVLAAVAGLSMHHFAREFKQSAGVTPHHYLSKSESNEPSRCWLRRISR